MKFHLMKPMDFKEIFKLWQKAGLTFLSKEVEEYEFNLILKYNPQSCFILKDKNKIIGAVLGAFNGRRGWIYHLAIHPKYQLNGYGSQLIKQVENTFKKLGATKILLTVSVDNLKIVPFYEKTGFQVENDAITMSKKLLK